jgi:hypothetical protein
VLLTKRNGGKDRRGREEGKEEGGEKESERDHEWEDKLKLII